MTDLPTRLALYELGRQYIITHARKIDPSQVDVAGSDANLYVGSQSYVGHAVVRQLGERVNALLLDGCDNEDLDRWVFDNLNGLIVRKGACAAVATVQFSRATATVGAGTIPAGTVVKSGDGIEYVTLADATFGALQLSATATVRATQAGHSYQVGRYQLRTFANLAAIFDSSMLVDNADPAAGGEDVEGDDKLRERARALPGQLRRGTLGAIEFGASSVVGVTSAMAMEVYDSLTPAMLTKVVVLYIADSSGVSNLALGNAVQVALGEWRAAGIQVVVSNSVPELTQVQLHLGFSGSVDTVALTAEVAAAVVSYVNSLGVNQPLLRNALGTVLTRFTSAGLVASAGSVVSPAGDLYPTTGYTLRMRPEDVVLV